MGITIGPGQFQDVNSSSAAGWVTIDGGGLQFIETGAYAWFTTINDGGEQEVATGGHAFGTTINAGGVQYDSGIATSTTLDGASWNYAKQFVGPSGYANETVINYGIQYVAGVADNTNINAGGEQIIWSGGTANNTAVYASGWQVVDSGTTYWTTVYAEGLQFVDKGSIAYYTTVDGDALHLGVMEVEAGGIADTTTINYHGGQDVYGMAKNTTVNGGEQAIWSGGGAIGTVVKGGGLELVGAGGVAVNTTLNPNATERVQAGGTADGVTFTSTNALLDLDTANSLTGPISGFEFADQIDLRNVQFGAGTTFNFSQGVLTVSDGSTVAKLSLLGQYTNADFSLSSDGHGGTFINGTQEQLGGIIVNPLHFS